MFARKKLYNNLHISQLKNNNVQQRNSRLNTGQPYTNKGISKVIIERDNECYIDESKDFLNQLNDNVSTDCDGQVDFLVTTASSNNDAVK